MLKFPPFTGAPHYPKQSCKMCFYYSHGSLYFKLFPSSWALSSFPAQYSSSHSSTLPGQARKMSQQVSVSPSHPGLLFLSADNLSSSLQFSHQKIKKEPVTSTVDSIINHIWMVMDFSLMCISICILYWWLMTEKQYTRVKQAPSRARRPGFEFWLLISCITLGPLCNLPLKSRQKY